MEAAKGPVGKTDETGALQPQGPTAGEPPHTVRSLERTADHPIATAGVPGPGDFDSIEEVDAAARSILRVALELAALFCAALFSVPLLSRIAERWSEPVWGGLSLNFIATAFVIPLLLLGSCALFARAADRIEEDMLGRPGEPFAGEERGDV